MVESPSFHREIEALRRGDEDAAREVFNRFAGRLAQLARSRLDQRLQQKIDGDDVVQSVFRSFFTRQADGQFELDSWDGLWSLLVRITIRKAGRRAVAFRTERRDVRRELHPDLSDEDSRAAWEAMARDPGPEEVVMLTDVVERLMRSLPNRDRDILTMRLQGYTAKEIGETVGRTERTVFRTLALLRKRAAEVLQLEQTQPETGDAQEAPKLARLRGLQAASA